MKIAILLYYAQMKWKSLSALPCILHKLCCLLSKKKKKERIVMIPLIQGL